MGSAKHNVFLEYGHKFGECFPRYELGSNEEIARECIEKGKTAEELGYIKDEEDENIKY